MLTLRPLALFGARGPPGRAGRRTPQPQSGSSPNTKHQVRECTLGECGAWQRRASERSLTERLLRINSSGARMPMSSHQTGGWTDQHCRRRARALEFRPYEPDNRFLGVNTRQSKLRGPASHSLAPKTHFVLAVGPMQGPRPLNASRRAEIQYGPPPGGQKCCPDVTFGTK